MKCHLKRHEVPLRHLVMAPAHGAVQKVCVPAPAPFQDEWIM
jgi:hypothetical protein